jgi:hypothetical protein
MMNGYIKATWEPSQGAPLAPSEASAKCAHEAHLHAWEVCQGNVPLDLCGSDAGVSSYSAGRGSLGASPCLYYHLLGPYRPNPHLSASARPAPPSFLAIIPPVHAVRSGGRGFRSQGLCNVTEDQEEPAAVPD